MPNKGRFMRNGVRSADMGIVATEQPEIIRPEERLPAAKDVAGRRENPAKPKRTHLQDRAGNESSAD